MDTDGNKPMKRIRHLSLTVGRLLLGIGLFGVFLFLLLFTPVGNRLLSPLIEKGISSAVSAPMTLETFELSPSHFHLEVYDDFNNTFTIQGKYSLVTLRAFGYYRIHFRTSRGINPFDMPLESSGAFSGRYSLLDILGDIEGLGGTLTYKARLNHLSLDSIHLHAYHIDMQPLLHLLGYPSITSTTLDGNILLNGFITRNIEGQIALETRTASYTPTPILEDANGSFDLISLLTNEKGYIKPFAVHVTAELNLEEAGVLEQILGIHVNGPLKLYASLAGDQHDLRLDSTTDLAQSSSTFSLGLQRLQPQELHFNVNHARVEKLFSFFNMNPPVGGIADASGDLNLSGGDIRLRMTHAVTYPDILKRDYNLTQPKIAFNANVSASLSRIEVHYKGSFRSDLSRFQIEGTTTHDQMLRELLSSIR